MRDGIRRALSELLDKSASDGGVSLDGVAAELFPLDATYDETEEVIRLFEESGGTLVPSIDGEARLKEVLLAARAIRSESGARATVRAIASRTALSEEDVRAALFRGQMRGR